MRPVRPGRQEGSIVKVCKCGEVLKRWCVRRWGGGYTAKQCERPGCPGPHVWAWSSVDLFALVNRATVGAARHDVLGEREQIALFGSCLPYDEAERRAARSTRLRASVRV